MSANLGNVGSVPDWTQGDRLRKAREAKDLSQKQLAELTGIERSAISRYENGTVKPTPPVLLSWAVYTDFEYGATLREHSPAVRT